MTKYQVAISFVAAAIAASPAFASNYNYQTLNNSGDPAFNQLLGINNSGTIVGYDGDGTVLPNKGYSLSQGTYTNENFPGSAQTQVVGINSNSSPTTVGFWVDGNGNNFGFVKQGGTFTSVSDPNTGTASPTVNQLLGVNNNNVAAGFYVDSNGLSQGYLYNIGTKAFTSIMDPLGVGGTTATGINNAGIVSGFYVDASDQDHGFLDVGGVFKTLNDPNGTNTMILGLNNMGEAVGSFVNGSGVTEGLIYNWVTNTWTTITEPNSSSNPAFGVTGTTVNGINDAGQLVGFYSDGTNVDGFLATPTPEPASLALMSLGLVAAGVIRKRNRAKA